MSGRLGPCVSQDAPSFGNSLSRCSIFRQVTLLYSVCVYVCVSGRLVWVFVYVKMLHPLATACQDDPSLSGDPLSSVHACQHIHVCVFLSTSVCE